MAKLHHYWQQPASALAIAHPLEAGHKQTGYIIVRRGHKKKRLHVWVWEELVGPIPDGMEVDHINGIKTDCRIENLRLVTNAVNARNRGKQVNNTSGVTGVSLINVKGLPYWSANWKDPITNKRMAKYFSVNKLGHDEAMRRAIKHRASVMEVLVRDHEYTERHGK